MTLAPVDPGTITTEQINELLDQETPCESTDCQSQHSEPASWITSHTGAQPSCTKLICASCAKGIERVIFVARMLHVHMKCAHCLRDCEVEDVLLRPMGG